MYALIEWLEDPPLWDVVPIRKFVRVNGEDAHRRKAVPGDKVHLPYKGDVAAAIVKELGEKHAMNIALDHIAKAMGDGNSSETDYEEVDQGRGKRKKVRNKRLASSPQVQPASSQQSASGAIVRRQLKNSEKQRSRHLLGNIAMDCAGCEDKKRELREKECEILDLRKRIGEMENLLEGFKDIKSVAAELRSMMTSLQGQRQRLAVPHEDNHGPQTAVEPQVARSRRPVSGGLRQESQESASDDAAERSRNASAPLFETSEYVRPQQEADTVMITIGEELKMPRSKLKAINWGNKDKCRPVRQMLVEVFGRDVLATSSLSGTVPNCHKEKGVVAKSKLDPGKMADLTAYCCAKLKLQDTEVRKIVTAKCNDEAKRIKLSAARD